MNNKNVLSFQTEVRNGPEFIPIKNFIKEFRIVVTLFDDNDNIVREEKMDYGKAEDRVWLGKLSFYAWSHGFTVETKADK